MMGLSIGLLLILQYFWLRSSYENERERLRKETSFMFRNTLLSMQDSMIQRNIQFIPDSSRRHPGHIKYWSRAIKDSLPEELELPPGQARVQVFVAGTAPDSLREMLRPLAQRMESGQQNFVVRFARDSLNLDSVRVKFEAELIKNESNLSFRVFKLQRGEEFAPEEGFWIDPVHLLPLDSYTVAFDDPQIFLLKKISPQILFSIFLSLLTASAFFLMYRSLRTQQKLMEIKNDFISNVTHELKTPVATVSVAIEALQNFQALNNPARAAEYLDIAQQELNRLTLMTDKILRTSVFEQQELVYQFKDLDFAPVITSVLRSLKLVFEKQGATVTFDTQGERFNLQGDVEHLTTMLYNLVDNALKYNTPKSKIDIQLTSLTDELCLSVQDNGIGIAPEYHKRLFEKFFRVPSGNVHNAKGYGLGLSYVAGVVSQHKGRIELKSMPNQGSCFSIYLPYQHGQNKNIVR